MKPTLIEIPLGPFTSPTGPKNYDCDCVDEWAMEDVDGCEKCNGTGRITGEYTPCQRESSEDDRISSDKTYLAKMNDCWNVGSFSKQWYGWNFSMGGHSVGLKNIEELYEIIIEPKV